MSSQVCHDVTEEVEQESCKPVTRDGECKQVTFADGFEDVSKPHMLMVVLIRVRKSKNFPDSKISTAKTFRIKCVNRDIDNFATNARKT